MCGVLCGTDRIGKPWRNIEQQSIQTEEMTMTDKKGTEETGIKFFREQNLVNRGK